MPRRCRLDHGLETAQHGHGPAPGGQGHTAQSARGWSAGRLFLQGAAHIFRRRRARAVAGLRTNLPPLPPPTPRHPTPHPMFSRNCPPAPPPRLPSRQILNNAIVPKTLTPATLSKLKSSQGVTTLASAVLQVRAQPLPLCRDARLYVSGVGGFGRPVRAAGPRRRSAGLLHHASSAGFQCREGRRPGGQLTPPACPHQRQLPDKGRLSPPRRPGVAGTGEACPLEALVGRQAVVVWIAVLSGLCLQKLPLLRREPFHTHHTGPAAKGDQTLHPSPPRCPREGPQAPW